MGMLDHRPIYQTVRNIDNPAAENTDISDVGLIDDLKLMGPSASERLGRGCIDLRGFNGDRGVIRFTGGASPTVTLQRLEVVRLYDNGEFVEDFFIPIGGTIGPYSHNALFNTNYGSSIYFVRIDAVTGSPTNLKILMAGDVLTINAFVFK